MEFSALWFTAANRAQLQTEKLSPLEKGECLIQTLYSAISLGTENLVFRGEVPSELHSSMRCPYMVGDFHFPVKYGYSLVGEVCQGPPQIIGKLVHVLHPHQDQCKVQIQDTHIIPEGVPPQRATLASNMETALNAIWESHVTIGDRVLVVGFGMIGSLIARLLTMIAEIDLIILETNSLQAKLAQQMGFTTINQKDLCLNSYDLAFHTSCSGEGLQTAIDAVGFEGQVIELSWYGTHNVSLKLGGAFHSLRKKIISSQVSHIATCQRSRWDYRRRKDVVFSLLQHSSFDAHITHHLTFSTLPEFFYQQPSKLYPRLGCLASYS